MPVSIHFYLKHHNIYSYNPLFSEFIQINRPDISESKSRFPDKNDLFACLVGDHPGMVGDHPGMVGDHYGNGGGPLWAWWKTTLQLVGGHHGNSG